MELALTKEVINTKQVIEEEWRDIEEVLASDFYFLLFYIKFYYGKSRRVWAEKV